jgi:hypothetical protein
MSPEEKRKLHEYNRGVKTLLDLTRRFNNEPATKTFQNPYSKMAGGTNSSDLVDSVKLGIPVHEMSQAIELARQVIGLGTPVTPFSEYIKQTGLAILLNDDIRQ